MGAGQPRQRASGAFWGGQQFLQNVICNSTDACRRHRLIPPSLCPRRPCASWSRIWPARSIDWNKRSSGAPRQQHPAPRQPSPEGRTYAPLSTVSTRGSLLSRDAASRARLKCLGSVRRWIGGPHIRDTLSIAPRGECLRQGIGRVEHDCLLSQSKPFQLWFSNHVTKRRVAPA